MRNKTDVPSRFALAVASLTVIALGSCAPAVREEAAPPQPVIAPAPAPVVTPPVAAPVPDDKARLEAEARERAEKEAEARAAAKAEAERRQAAARRAAAAKAAREKAAREKAAREAAAREAAAKAEAEKKVEPPPPPKANLARYVPAKMMQDVAAPVDLWADRKLGDKPLQDALLAFVHEREARATQGPQGEAPQAKAIAGGQADGTDAMEAELEFDKAAFRVTPEGRQRQDFRGRDQLRWNWQVTGIAAGVHHLTLHVRRIDATGTAEETYTDTVTVEAKPKSFWDRVVEMDNWLKAAILAVALVLAWVAWRIRARG